MLKWMVIGLGVLLAAAVLVLLAITWIESCQARQVAGIEPHAPPAAAPSGTVVVYFSRSGNTALAARHVARRLGASLHAIEVPRYALGPAGLARSALDAKARRDDSGQLPDIRPRTLDLTRSHTVWLGSSSSSSSARSLPAGCGSGLYSVTSDISGWRRGPPSSAVPTPSLDRPAGAVGSAGIARPLQSSGRAGGASG